MCFVHTTATTGWVLWFNGFSLTVHVPWAVMNVPLVACRKASAPACAHQTSDMPLTHIKSSEQQPTVNVTLDGLFTYLETPLLRSADRRLSPALVTQCRRSGWKIGNVGLLTLHAKLYMLLFYYTWCAGTIPARITVANQWRYKSQRMFACGRFQVELHSSRWKKKKNNTLIRNMAVLVAKRS